MFRRVLNESIRYGRRIFDNVFQREGTKTVPRHPNKGPIHELEGPANAVVRAKGFTKSRNSSLLGNFFARNNTNNLANQYAKDFRYKLQSGSFAVFGRNNLSLRHRLALYGFVAVGVSGGSQICRNGPNDIDDICDQIRGYFKAEIQQKEGEIGNIKFADLEFGKLIAKGCNAAVFEATLQKNECHETCDDACDDDIKCPTFLPVDESDEFPSFTSCHSDFTVISESDTELAPTEWTQEDIYAEDLISLHSDSDSDADDSLARNETPNTEVYHELAVKIMFNYDAESNAAAILETMNKELIPSKMGDSLLQMETWEKGNHPKKKRRLPPHPNIVDMVGAYVDDMPDLPEGYSEYPHALPRRLNEDGYGRNQTMFILMKKYDCTLREYLSNNTLSTRESLLLLTQLIEGIHHMRSNNVAHRDLKSDNLLLDGAGPAPNLVISDFGCCLAQNNGRLWVPYLTDETNKGGNGSLMAPEVATAKPGWLSYLSFAKSDIWAAGALAYEIFGASNPFYRARGRRHLDSVSYTEKDLPPFPDGTPAYVKAIVKLMLKRAPKRRPDAETILYMLHFVLWCPPGWLGALERGRSRRPSQSKLRKWIVMLTAQVIIEGNSKSCKTLELQKQFLSRLDLRKMIKALDLLCDNCKK